MTDGMNRLMNGLKRLARYRLVIPIKRDRNAPDFVARGVCIGMVVALTPTVGIQMPIVALLWITMRTISKQLDFSVIIAMAWTWVTNVFTVAPVYYVFFVSGQLMLGKHLDVQGYSAFVAQLQGSQNFDAGFLESAWVYTESLLRTFGVPMFIGSIPWAIAGGWMSYRLSYRYSAAHQERRRVKQEKVRLKQRGRPSSTGS